MWVARDEDEQLFLFRTKPKKDIKNGVWISPDLDYYELEFSYKWMFKNVKWSDKEPTKINLTNKGK